MQKQNPKERIRGPNLEVRIKQKNGVSFRKAFEEANKENRTIASNERMDKALQSDEWKQFKEGLLCWTGTMTAYVESDTAFKDSKMFSKEENALIYVDQEDGRKYIFPVSHEYQNKKNAILVVEHPDYSLEIDGNNIIIHAEEKKVDIVSGFPSENGWYLVDEKYGIPYGTRVISDNENARCLWRTDKRTGPISRGYILDVEWRDIGLDGRPSIEYGVIVEAPKVGPKKLRVEPEEKLRITKEHGKLIIEGTKEQLKEAERLLKFSFFP